MPLTDEQRQHIVEVAKTWYGTPYRACTCIKGVGADCGQLLKGVFLEAGIRPKDGVPTPESYSVRIGMHRRSTEYLDHIEKYFREIPESEVKPGDVVVYKMHKSFCHAAIVVKWAEYVIHCLEREGVHAGHGANFKFGRLEKKFYSVRDEYC